MQFSHSRSIPNAVATVGVDERVAFIRRTYAHLAAAIGVFVLSCFILVKSDIALPLTEFAVAGQWNWLMFLGAFMLVSWVADKWARSDTSQSMQYLGLVVYTLAEAVIFTPLLYIAATYAPASTIPMAAVITLAMFAGLTATVFITKKDFSFLRGALGLGMMGAFGLIIAGAIFGFTLGLVFSFAMVLLASGYILYYTSQVLAHYRPTQHVAAALALFSAVALLFWYVLQIVMSMSRD